MSNATHQDILRIFPGLPEHAVTKLVGARATLAELDAAMLALEGNDEALVDFRRREGGRLEYLLNILSAAGIEAEGPADR